MPKNTKSSASSATRKKKAAKAAKKGGVEDIGQSTTSNGADKGLQRGQKKIKGKKKEPKKKIYIPPVKPKADVVDPLDSLGLASLLPADLVVLLRKAAKKDVTTRIRALEGIVEWQKASGTQDDAEVDDETSPEIGQEEKDAAFIIALPSWTHLFPRLVTSPNRRLRQLTVQVTSFAVGRPDVKAELAAQPALVEQIAGPLLVVAHGPDRLISRMALTLFESIFAWSAEDRLDLRDFYSVLIEHLSVLLFQDFVRPAHDVQDAEGKSSAFASGTATPTLARDAKNRDDVQVEEDAEGTDGRLVAGAIGSLTWLLCSNVPEEERERILPLLSESMLWSALSAEVGNEDRSLGHFSPFVRISGWNLLRCLVTNWPQSIDSCLRTVAPTALYSAFQETDVLVVQSMREGLIRLLRLRPDTWIVAGEQEKDDGDEGDDNEDSEGASTDSSEDDEEVSGSKELAREAKSAHTPSKMTLAAFLQYLRGGVCNIAASYSIVILLIATIPAEVMSPSSENALEVIRALYVPIDERTVEGKDMQRALLSSFLECLVWLTGRVSARTSIEEATEVAKGIEMIWGDLFISNDRPLAGHRSLPISNIGEDRLSKELATCLRKLGNIDVALARPMLGLLRNAYDTFLATPDSIPIHVITHLLEETIAPKEEIPPVAVKSQVQELVRDITFTTANIVASGESAVQGVTILTMMLKHFSDIQTSETIAVVELANTQVLRGKQRHIPSDQKAAFGMAFIFLPSLERRREEHWQGLLEAVVRDDGKIDWSLLRSIQDNLGDGGILEMQGRCQALDVAFVQQYADNLAVSARLVAKPAPILRSETATKVITSITRAKDLTTLPILEAWLKADNANVERLTSSEELRGIVPEAYRAAIFAADRHAVAIWALLSRQENARRAAQGVLRDEVANLDRPIAHILSEVERSQLGWAGVLPPLSESQKILGDASSNVQAGRLAITDPLVELNDSVEPNVHYGEDGYSVVARMELSILAAVEQERQLRLDATHLPFLIDFAIAAEDSLLETVGGQTHFRRDLPLHVLAEQLEQSVSTSTSILAAHTSKLDVTWYAELCSVLQGRAEVKEEDTLQVAFKMVWTQESAHRTFARLLKGCLNFGGAGTEEASVLLRLAQGVQQTRPLYAHAIVLAVKPLCLESPLYDRLRNQAAADLAGVKSSEASGKGAELLAYVMHLAPPLDSPISLIPQQRAIFLLRALQAWIASDEELSPKLMTSLAQVSRHLLPIVQDMPGGHLDLVIDIVEMNLDEASLKGDLNIVQAYHSLLLLESVVGLAERSATLRAVWKDRKADVLATLRNFLFRIAEGHDPSRSSGRVSVEEAAADVMHLLPANMFKDDFDSLLKLTQLHTTSSLPIMAYRVLAHTIREQVQEQIIENAVGTKQAEEALEQEDGETDGGSEQALKLSKALQERKVKQQLPASLLAIVDDSSIDNLLAYLLAWLTVFEFFEENSLELRASYTSQLQNRHLIDGKLLPLLLSFLSTTKEHNRFELDEIFLEHLDGTDTQCLETFTVHIFYRALIHTPSLVCDAFFAIKDKQQSSLLKSLTMRYLTPLLSQREFGHLREPNVLSRLQDENMQIKVLANISEVVATYTVDEYPLELAISMPNDYPLHPVEVRDLRKIGISEGTWRAWILGMRQLIAGRNGLIFDALLLFKRNVEAKFSGFDEDSTCSICYSIVSPTDHSLPTKPCKTCKKRFHASCLYKWVSTSGSSTCPLCRSIL